MLEATMESKGLDMDQPQSLHGQWSSRWAFILAAAGAAVGLGNIWKFPYITGQNGGGAFVLFYLLCIAAIGVPVMMAELIVGRHGRSNPAASMQFLAQASNRSSHWNFVGGMGIIAGVLILSFYCVISGWALEYVFQAGMGHFNNASALEIDALFENFMHSPTQLILWQSIILVSTVIVVAAGVEKGLERAVRYLFPAMLLLMLVIVGYSITTGYFAHGVKFLFRPDFHALTPGAMLVALGHAFFTLSLAIGSIMMYGAYVPKDFSLTKATLYIAGADTLVALIAGLAIFPIVFAHGLEPAAGPGLIFKTLPLAFGHMLYGQFFATLFFIMLVFAAFTSAISLLEPSVAWLIEKFQISRRASSLFAGFVIWLLGLGTVFSFNIWSDYKIFGLNFFEVLDELVTNIMLPLGGALLAVFSAWYVKQNINLQELNCEKGLLYWSWRIALGVIVPLVIFTVFLNGVGIIHINGVH